MYGDSEVEFTLGLKDMNAVSPKKKSFVALLVTLSFVPLMAILSMFNRSLEPAALAMVPVGFLIAASIKCPHCGAKVKGPGGNFGTLVLLWAVQESCSRCHRPLTW
jgi:hypothetical protein